MKLNLGDALEQVILNHKEVMPTQQNFLKGLEIFLNENINDYSLQPSFLINGTINTSTGPVIYTGLSGSISTIRITPLTVMEWESIIKPVSDQEILEYKFYKRLAKIIKLYFSEKIFITVDAKGINASSQIPIIDPIIFSDITWGNYAQERMDSVQPNTHEQWISEMNLIGSNILTNCIPKNVMYTSPCTGGVFTGTLTVKF